MIVGAVNKIQLEIIKEKKGKEHTEVIADNQSVWQCNL